MSKELKDYKGHDVEEISLRKVTVIILISVILVLIFFLVSREYFINTTEEVVYEMVLKPESEKLIETRSYEKEMLTSFKQIEGESGKFQIPVEDAKEILAKDYEKKLWTTK